MIEVVRQQRQYLDGEVSTSETRQTIFMIAEPSPCVRVVNATVNGSQSPPTESANPLLDTEPVIADFVTWPVFYLQNLEALSDATITASEDELVVILAPDVWTLEDLRPQRGATSASMYMGDLEAPVNVKREVRIGVDTLEGREVLTAIDARGVQVTLDSSSLTPLDQAVETGEFNLLCRR